MKISTLILFGCLISFFSLNQLTAQKVKPDDYGIKSKKALKLYFDAQELDFRRQREEAMAVYQQAIELEPDFAHAHFHLGKLYYVREKYDEALPYIQKAYSLNAAAFPSITRLLGPLLFYAEKYDEAIPVLGEYLNKGVGLEKDIEQIKYFLRQSVYASEAIKDSVPFQPENLGPSVNSPGDESQPFLTADGELLLFTGRRPGSVGGFNEDIYQCQWQDSAWSMAQNIGRPINDAFNQGAAAISQDGRMLIFVGCQLPGGEGSCDLYFSTKTGDKWAAPRNMGPLVNTRHWESDPQLADDGKTLFFSSARPGGMGKKDIWYSKWNGKRWGEPVNMGDAINTEGNERAPFLHADGESFYFASTHHPGFGYLDLFVSYRNRDSSWATPVNLGYPINTASDDDNIFIAPNGKVAYFNSRRLGGLGGSDLYQFELPQKVRPKIATFLRGLVLDSLTDKPVAAEIKLLDVDTRDTIRHINSDPVNGKFLASIPVNREYAAFVEAKGYLFASQNFYLKDLEEETYFDILIQMVPFSVGKQVVLENIFFEFNDYKLKETSDTELEFLFSYMKENPRMVIEIQGHTDDLGTEEYNLDLSQKRADAVKDYLIKKGINETRILAKGYGESMPVAGNITEEDRARNRRTEFKIISVGK